jgi:hypothetical protein
MVILLRQLDYILAYGPVEWYEAESFINCRSIMDTDSLGLVYETLMFHFYLPKMAARLSKGKLVSGDCFAKSCVNRVIVTVKLRCL